MEIQRDLKTGAVLNKFPTTFEKRRWDRGVALDAQRRKEGKPPLLPDGEIKFPWSANTFELIAPKEPGTKVTPPKKTK